MVDEPRLARLLGSIDERLERLRALPEVGGDGSDGPDEIVLDAAKYLLITAIEGVVAVAHHLVSSERLGVPDTNAAAIRLLGTHRIIPSEVAEALAEATGFRNILVHQYTRVDDRIVVGALDRLGDLDAFVEAVARWTITRGRSGDDVGDGGADRSASQQA